MKKNSFKIVMSTTLLLGLLSACGSSSPSDSSVCPIDDSTPGTIVISDYFPSEILMGDDNALDLDDYVRVSGVSCYTVNALTDNLRVEGHLVIADDYGPYSFSIKAGSTTKTLSGTVVTAKKIALNEALDSLSSYYVYNGLEGLSIIGEGYYANTYLDSGEVTVYNGGIEDPSTGIAYPYYVGSYSISSLGQTLPFSAFQTGKGYARNKAEMGYDASEINGSLFTECRDDYGDPTGLYLFDALSTSADEAHMTAISDFYGSLLGKDSEFYLYLSSYTEACNLFVKYHSGMLTLLPADKKGNLIPSITIGSYQYSSAVTLWNIGNSHITDAETWRKSPVLPTPIPTDDIQAYFDMLGEANSFTMNISGAWVNTVTGNKVATPGGMVFADTGTEIFNVFDNTLIYASDAIEGYVNECDENISLSSNSIQLKPGDRQLSFYGNPLPILGNKKKLFSIDGHSNDEEFAYDPSSLDSTMPKQQSFWEKGSLPKDMLSTAPTPLLQGASITDRVIEEGVIKYSYNPCGLDVAVNGDKRFGGGIAKCMSTLATYGLTDYNLLYSFFTGWAFNSSDYYLILDTNTNVFTFEYDFIYSTGVNYIWSVSFSDINSSTLSIEAMDIINQYR